LRNFAGRGRLCRHGFARFALVNQHRREAKLHDLIDGRGAIVRGQRTRVFGASGVYCFVNKHWHIEFFYSWALLTDLSNMFMFVCLKGKNIPAQGNALGLSKQKMKRPERAQQSCSVHFLYCPFRALNRIPLNTQGVALG
jgi:hypothetical protein